MMKNFPRIVGLEIIFSIIFATAIPVYSFADSSLNYIKNNPDGSQTLTGHMPRELKNGAATFKNHVNQFMTAQIIMPLGNQANLNTLIQNLYNPKSPNFHQFLTPSQFAQSFAPSIIDVMQVQEYLNRNGINVIGQTGNGSVLDVSGSVGAFEKAFGLHVNNYQKSDGTLFFAPDAEPTIPASLAGKILAIGGLDNLPKYMAHAQPLATAALPKAVGTGPGGYLAPSDVKTAYNLNSVTSTGVGQNVALFELDGYKASDINSYESKFSLPNVLLQNTLIDGFNGTPNYGSNGGAAEVTLDIELVTAFASGVNNVYVYEAPNTTQSWIDEWKKIASDDKAKVISCSWGEPEVDSPTLSFDNQIFAQMAAQGQAVFVAAGDNGAYDAGGSTLGVDEPASQPYATAVGISKLTTTSSGAYSSETASVYGGGGISQYWTIPAYQTTLAAQAVKAAKASTTMRNLPDVVLTADAATPYSFFINGGWAGYYGSSISAPIWASFITRVDQGLGSNAPVGSVNSALYQLAQTTSYANDFHDITTGTNGYYPAETGFDDATGLGSFNGQNLYNDLVKVSVPTTAPLAPTGLNATVGNAQVSLSWTASIGATSYDVKRSTSNGGPYTTIATLVLNTSYTDTSVTNSTLYYYVVSAVNAAGQGSNSVQVSAIPALPIPAAPSGLSATPGNATVTLSWTASVNASSYNVKRAATSSGTYTTIASLVTNTNYTDKTVSNGSTYYYVVSAGNASGQSANSAQVAASPAAAKGVLPVTNLTGVVTTFYGKPAILIEWKQSASPNIYKYNVYRSTGNNTPTFYGSISASYIGAYDPGVSYGITYNYDVTAVNTSNVESPASSKIVVVMPAAPTVRR